MSPDPTGQLGAFCKRIGKRPLSACPPGGWGFPTIGLQIRFAVHTVGRVYAVSGLCGLWRLLTRVFLQIYTYCCTAILKTVAKYLFMCGRYLCSKFCSEGWKTKSRNTHKIAIQILHCGRYYCGLDISAEVGGIALVIPRNELIRNVLAISTGRRVFRLYDTKTWASFVIFLQCVLQFLPTSNHNMYHTFIFAICCVLNSFL